MWPRICVSVSGPLTGFVVYNVCTRVVFAFRPSCKELIVSTQRFVSIVTIHVYVYLIVLMYCRPTRQYKFHSA